MSPKLGKTHPTATMTLNDKILLKKKGYERKNDIQQMSFISEKDDIITIYRYIVMLLHYTFFSKKGGHLTANDIIFRTICSIAPKSVLFCCIMDNLVKKGMREREEFPHTFFF